MYKKVGSKIKSLVKGIVGVGMVASVILGLLCMFGVSFLGGILLAGMGCLMSWLSGLLMYAYGEMVDCIQDIRNRLDGEGVRVERNDEMV